MKVRLKRRLVVNGIAYPIGTELDLPEEEIKRFGNDIEVLEKPQKKKKAKKEAPEDKMVKEAVNK